MFCHHNHHRSHFLYGLIFVKLLLLAFVLGRSSTREGCMFQNLWSSMRRAFAAKSNISERQNSDADLGDTSNSMIVGEGVR